MNCGYCLAANSDHDHRCRRCGRRLDSAAPLGNNAGADAYNRTALAAAPQAANEPVAEESAPDPPRRDAGREAGVPWQRALFPFRPESKVISLEQFTSSRPAAPAQRTGTRAAPRRRYVDEKQGALDFLPSAAHTPRLLKTNVEAVICCDAPVATILHRSVAAALDCAMILIGYALFLITFHLRGGTIVLNSKTALVYVGVLAMIAVFYGAIWTVAGRETPGKSWTDLRLTNFDGAPPAMSERLIRFAGTCLSVGALGAGLLWALVDEETLTWQDHMSNTFPTLRETGSNLVHTRS